MQDQNRSYRNVTMFCHQQDLLLRMSDQEDKPFVIFSKDTLQEDKDREPYKMAEDSEKSLCWTPLNTVFEENSELGNRWCREMPFFSDGELIYTIVRYKKTNYESEVVRTALEIYECEGNILKFREELFLFKNEEKQPFKGSRGKSSYLRRGSIACNGRNLIWHSNNRHHIFDCGSGVRVHKNHVNSTDLISTYDAKENYYYHMDACCYSWLKRWRFTNFKPRVITKVVKELPDLPIVFDTSKSEILTKIKEIKEKNAEQKKKDDLNKETPMTNLFTQLALNEKPVECKHVSQEENKE